MQVTQRDLETWATPTSWHPDQAPSEASQATDTTGHPFGANCAPNPSPAIYEPPPAAVSDHLPPSLPDEESSDESEEANFVTIAQEDMKRFRQAVTVRLHQLEVLFNNELEVAFSSVVRLHEAHLKELIHKWTEDHGYESIDQSGSIESLPDEPMHARPAAPHAPSSQPENLEVAYGVQSESTDRSATPQSSPASPASKAARVSLVIPSVCNNSRQESHGRDSKRGSVAHVGSGAHVGGVGVKRFSKIETGPRRSLNHIDPVRRASKTDSGPGRPNNEKRVSLPPNPLVPRAGLGGVGGRGSIIDRVLERKMSSASHNSINSPQASVSVAAYSTQQEKKRFSGRHSFTHNDLRLQEKPASNASLDSVEMPSDDDEPDEEKRNVENAQSATQPPARNKKRKTVNFRESVKNAEMELAQVARSSLAGAKKAQNAKQLRESDEEGHTLDDAYNLLQQMHQALANSGQPGVRTSSVPPVWNGRPMLASAHDRNFLGPNLSVVPHQLAHHPHPGLSTSGNSPRYRGGSKQENNDDKARRSEDEKPPELEVAEVWLNRRRKTASVGTLRVMAFEEFEEDARDLELPTHGDEKIHWWLVNFFQRQVVQPNSIARLLWDLIGCLFILHDIVYIPLQTFDKSTDRIMQWAMRVFWTMDMPCTVLTGFMYADGNLEMDIFKIAKRYAQTWFILDVLVVVFDWIDVFMRGINGVTAARMAKTMRVVRMLRVFRLLRMAKLPLIAGTNLETYVRSEKVLLVGHMVKIMGVIMFTIHFIACIWWGIGKLEDQGGRNWINDDLEKAKFDYQYSTSFHWSLTQFTGTMEINPVNVTERLFSIIVLLFAFVISAMFISSITSSMTRLQMISGSKTAMFAALRQYLCDNNISTRLVGRISRNAHHAFEEYQRTTPESEVELLQLVSEPLRVELHFELYAPTLALNPFFLRYQEANPAAVRRVCHSAVSVTFLSMGDVLFVDGEEPQMPVMWFILRGALSYKRQDEDDMRRISLYSPVGCWICEPTLWCSWTHCGVLRADTDCRLLVLDAATFQVIAPQFATKNFQVGLYAVEFVARLNKHLEQGTLSDIDETKESQAAVDMVFRTRKTQEDGSRASKKSFWQKTGISRATKIFGDGDLKRVSAISTASSHRFPSEYGAADSMKSMRSRSDHDQPEQTSTEDDP